MATTVSKIHKDQRLEITGELNERLPNIQDGLVAHYEFDETTTGWIPDPNILDDSNWVAGTSGTVGNWAIVGTAAENTRINKTNPFGYTDVVWATPGNDVVSDGDGGWQNHSHTIDKTKTYRLSIWVKRENIGNGRTYFGCQHSTVSNLGQDVANTNPYFVTAISSELPEMSEQWLLWVAHIHPYTYGGSTHTDSGIYTLGGKKLSRVVGDFKWLSSATIGGHRSFLHYSTSTTERHYQYNPRMEIIDSQSSTLEDLLKQQYNIVYPLDDQNTLLNTYGVGSQGGYRTTTNVVLNPTGNSGAGAPGSYTPGWDATLHPTATTVSNWSGGYNSGVGSPTIGYHSQWVYEGTDGSPCMKFIDRNDLFSLGHRWLGISELVSSNVDTSWSLVSGLKTVTMSWDQKVDNLGKYSNVGFYHKENATNTFGTSGSNHSNTVINQWERMTKTYTVTSAWDAGTPMTLYFYGHNGAYATLWIDNIQLEIDRNYDTPFVDGGGLTSLLEIPNPVNTGGNFTVNFWAKILPSQNTTGAYHTIFSMGEYYTNNSFTIMDSDGTLMDGNQKLIRKTNTAGWAWANAPFTVPADFQDYNMYTVIRGSTNYDCYLNGVYKGYIAHGSTTMQDNCYIGSIATSTRLCPSYMKRLSFYNKAITTDDLKSLYGIGSIKSNGNFVIDYANEPNPNIYPNADLETTTYPSQGNGTVTLEQDENGRYHQMILNNTTSTWRGFIIDDGPRIGLTHHEGIEVGETYIFSGYFWRSTGSSPQYYTVRAEGTAGGTILGPTWSSISESTWTYCSLEFVADDSQNCLVYPSGGTTGATGTFRWRNLSVVKKLDKELVLNNTRDLYTRDIIDE